MILNPKAGNRVARAWSRYRPYFAEAGYLLTENATEYARHAEVLVEKGLRSGFRQILIIGGDGTHHEVTNGILKQGLVPSSEITYALLPLGTGNDWVRSHNISRKWADWWAMFQRGNTVVQDAGKVTYTTPKGLREQRFFVNVAGMAYDAFVVSEMDKRPRHLVRNRFFYLYFVFRCLFQYKLPFITIAAPGFQWAKRCYTVNVGINRYSGGGMQLVPHASSNRGVLALTAAGSLSKFAVLWATPLFYNGKLGTHPKVTLREVTKLTVNSTEQVQLELDGELVGFAPADFSIRPACLRFVAP